MSVHQSSSLVQSSDCRWPSDSAKQLGFEKVKKKQLEAVCAFVQGHDTFVSLPTGYGKSTIYAILPYVFDKLKGINIKAVDLLDLKGS